MNDDVRTGDRGAVKIDHATADSCAAVDHDRAKFHVTTANDDGQCFSSEAGTDDRKVVRPIGNTRDRELTVDRVLGMWLELRRTICFVLIEKDTEVGNGFIGEDDRSGDRDRVFDDEMDVVIASLRSYALHAARVFSTSSARSQ